MSQKVNIEMVATQAGILKEIEKLNKKLDDSEKKLDKISKTSQKASREGTTGFQSMGKSLQTVGMVATGVMGTLIKVSDILGNLRRTNEAIIAQGRAASNMNVGPALAARRLNLNLQPGGDFKSREEGQKFVQEIARRQGLKFEQFEPLASAALSGRGNLNEKFALGIAEKGSQIFRTDFESGGGAVALALDLAKRTGETDPKKLIGFATQLQAAFPGSEFAETSRAAPAAIGGMVNAGGSAEFGAELFAAIATGSSDFTGKRTGTFTNKVAPQLRQLEIKRGKTKDYFGNDVDVTQQDIAALEEAKKTGDPQKIFEAIQGRSTGQAATSLIQGEAAQLSAFNQLLLGDQKAIGQLRQAQKTILPFSGKAQSEFFDQLAADQLGGKFEGVQRAGERNEAGQEAALAGTVAARRGRAREILEAQIRDNPSVARAQNFLENDLTFFDEFTDSKFTSRYDLLPDTENTQRLRKIGAEQPAMIAAQRLSRIQPKDMTDQERAQLLAALEALAELNSGVRSIINKVNGAAKPQQPAAALNGR